MEPMTQRQVKDEIIRIAAVLVQGHFLPSDLVDDYPQKTYTAGRVAKMMGHAHGEAKDLAVQLKQLADRLAPVDLAELQAWKAFAVKKSAPCNPVISRSSTTGKVDVVLVAP